MYSKAQMALMRNRFKRAKKKIYEYLAETHGERCADCKADRMLTIDHIKSLCEGGDNEFENFQLLCAPCHQRKDKMEKTGRGKRHRRRNRRAALGYWQTSTKKEWKEKQRAEAEKTSDDGAS